MSEQVPSNTVVKSCEHYYAPVDSSGQRVCVWCKVREIKAELSPQKERVEFERWLFDTQGLESVWEPHRNCHKDFAAHLAFKAWQAARAAPEPAAEPIQRYELDSNDRGAWLGGDDNGPFVRYDDHIRIVDKLRKRVAELERFIDFKDEVRARWEKQLGIAPNSTTDTIGSRIEDLLNEIERLRASQPPAPEYVAVIRKIRAHTSYTRPSVACDLIDRIAVICDEALGITNAPAICKEPGCGQALEPYAGCPAHDRATSTKEGG